MKASIVCVVAALSTASFEVIRPLGDTYNERATDGNAYPQSLLFDSP